MDCNISESARFSKTYDELLQKVKARFNGSYCEYIGISTSKASRVINGQFDILTLLEMASFVGYDCGLFIIEREG